MPDNDTIPPLPKGYVAVNKNNDTEIPPLPKGYVDVKKKVVGGVSGLDANAGLTRFMQATRPNQNNGSTNASTQESDGHSDSWNKMQSQMAKKAADAGLPHFDNGNDRLSDAISRSEKAGYGFNHFTNNNDPTGDRTVSIDIENLTKALQKRLSAETNPTSKKAISKELGYWQSELKDGMTAAEWKAQTGEEDPIPQPSNPFSNAQKPTGTISNQQVLDAQRHTQDVGGNNEYTQSVEGAKQAVDERHTQAANNTAALYFKNNPQAISDNNFSLKTIPNKNALNIKGGDKFSLKNLQHATPFQIKAAQIKTDLDNGDLTTYVTDEGEIRAAKSMTGLKNTVANFKQAWDANKESGKILSMNDEEFKQYASSKPDNEYLPTKPNSESLSGQTGQALPIAIKGTVGSVAGATMAAAAPETAGISTAGLPVLMAWMMTAPEMAKTQAAQGKVKAYKDAIAQGKTPDEAIEIAKSMATANYAEGMALGTLLTELPSFVPKSASTGFMKSYAQHLALLPTAAGAQGLSAGVLTDLKDEYAKHLGLNVTDAEKNADFNNSFNGMAGMALAFGVVHGLVSSDGATKAQANNVISKIPADKLHDIQNAEIQRGTLTQEQVDAANKSIADFQSAKKTIIPSGNEEKDVVISGLIQKRKNLEEAKKNVDAAYHPELDAQIESANTRIQLAKNSDNPIRYAETDDLTGQAHFPVKEFEELSRPEKNNIDVPKEFGETVVKPNDNERFSATVEIGGKQEKVEGDFASKESAQKAADDILKQKYYENELPTIEKPESKKKEAEVPISKGVEGSNINNESKSSNESSKTEKGVGEVVQSQQEKVDETPLRSNENYFLRYTENPELDIERGTSVHQTDFKTIEEANESYPDKEFVKLKDGTIGEVIDGTSSYMLESDNLNDAIQEAKDLVEYHKNNSGASGNNAITESREPILFKGKYVENDLPDGDSMKPKSVAAYLKPTENLKTNSIVEDKTDNPKVEDKPIEQKVEDNRVINKQDFHDNVLNMAEGMKDSNFDWRLTIPIANGDENLIHSEYPPTSLNYSGTGKLETEFGIDQRNPTQVKHDIETIKEADNLIEKGWKPKDAIDRVESGEATFVSDAEYINLTRYGAELAHRLRSIEDINSPEYDKTLKELNKVANVANAAGKEAGRALGIRGRFKTVPDGSYADFMLTEMAANNDVTLTKNQKEVSNEQYEKFQKDKEQFDKDKKEFDDAVAKFNAEKEAAKLKSETKKNARKTHEERVAYRSSEVEKAREALKKLRTGESGLSSVPLPGVRELIAIAPHVKNVLADLLEEGALKLSDAIDNVCENFKEFGVSKRDIHDIIAGEHDETKVKPTKTEAKIAMENLRIEAQNINRLEQLEKGVEPKKEKAKIKRNAEIEALQKKIKEHGVTKLSELKKRNETETQKIKDLIAKGDFAPEEKKVPTMQNPEFQKRFPDLFKKVQKSNDELIKTRNDIAIRRAKWMYEHKTGAEKTQEVLAKSLNIPRTLMTIGDFSAVFRQAAVATSAHPIIASKALKFMFEAAASEKIYNRWLDEVHNDPLWSAAQKSKLPITDPESLHAKEHEEAFYGAQYAEKIPGVGVIVKGSERAYNGYLNFIRWEMFKMYADKFMKQGKTVDNNPELYKGISSFIGSSTGRGGVGSKLETAAPLLNNFLFASRLIAARVNMLGLSDIPNLGVQAARLAVKGATLGKFDPQWGLNFGFYSKLPPAIRIEAAKEMAKFVGVGIATLVLAKQMGANVELDPRSSDFGKIHDKNTRWDIWGGFQPYARLIAQIVTEQAKSANTGRIYDLDGSKYGGRNIGDQLSTFGRGKLAPIWGELADFVTKRTLDQQTLERKFDIPFYSKDNPQQGTITLTDEMLKNITPLLVNDVRDAMKDRGVSGLFTVGIPSLFGIGVQTYSPKVPKSSSSKLQTLKRSTLQKLSR